MGLHFKWRCMCVSNCFPPKMHLSSVIRQTIQQLGEGCFSKEEEATLYYKGYTGVDEPQIRSRGVESTHRDPPARRPNLQHTSTTPIVKTNK